MPASLPPKYLLASAEPELLTAAELVFRSHARVDVVFSAQEALAAMTVPQPPDLALLDVALPGMEIGQLLAAVRAETGCRFPIVLISDTATQEWNDRLGEGIIDDVILRGAEFPYWQLRVERTLRAHRLMFELEHLRDASARNVQLDRLTGVYSREALLAFLFRETDRVQRMNGSLSVVLFDVDDFGHWNSRLGVDACDELLCQIATRTSRLLRSYDLLGRPGKDEFLIALPGCATAHAEMLAERLRLEVFSAPFQVNGDAVRLSACFGIASSQGRSPIVVLREAEQALAKAQHTGPESIQSFGAPSQQPPAPVAFLPSPGDELPAW